MEILTVQQKQIAFAESCTAGLVSDFLARIPGASKVLWGSFVTYTVGAKIKMLGVPEELIARSGAVSKSVVEAMASGALEKSGACWAFSVSGFAGPAEKEQDFPVGTVWIGIAGRGGETEAKMFNFSGSRNEVREAAALTVLEEVLKRIKII